MNSTCKTKSQSQISHREKERSIQREKERRHTLQQPWRKQTPIGGSKIAIIISQHISQRDGIFKNQSVSDWKQRGHLSFDINKTGVLVGD